jgi:Transcriptional regulators
MSSNQSPTSANTSGANALPDTSQRFGRLLGSVFRKWRRYADNEFRELGFTDATRGPLIALYDHNGAMRQRDLAHRLGLEASALVRVIPLLEKRELLTCATDPSDRRSKLISLTPAGRKWAERIIAQSYEAERRFLASISEQELKVSKEVLTKILNNIPDN